MVVSGKRCPYCGSELDLVTFLDVSEGELTQEILFIECSRCGMILGIKGRSTVRGLLEFLGRGEKLSLGEIYRCECGGEVRMYLEQKQTTGGMDWGFYLECVSCRNQFRVVGEKNPDVIVKMWKLKREGRESV